MAAPAPFLSFVTRTTPKQMRDFVGSSELYTMKERKQSSNRNVKFDDSRTFWYHDTHFQQERRHLYYTSQELAAFRSESRQAFMEWCIKRNFNHANCKTLIDQVENSDEEEDIMSSLRGLESYYEGHINPSGDDKEEGNERRILKMQQHLSKKANGTADPRKLAAFAKSLSKQELLKAINRAVKDEKIARIIYQDDFSTDASSSTVASDDELAIDFISGQFSVSGPSFGNPAHAFSGLVRGMSASRKSVRGLRKIMEGSSSQSSDFFPSMPSFPLEPNPPPQRKFLGSKFKPSNTQIPVPSIRRLRRAPGATSSEELRRSKTPPPLSRRVTC